VLARAGLGSGLWTGGMRAVHRPRRQPGAEAALGRAHAGNIRSERLLAGLGFEEEGYLRGHIQAPANAATARSSACCSEADRGLVIRRG